MSVVTPQGKAAAERLEQLSEKFKEDVIWVLATQGPTSPMLLHSYLRMVPEYAPEIVREAMWRLIDEGTIRICVDRSLDLEIKEATDAHQ